MRSVPEQLDKLLTPPPTVFGRLYYPDPLDQLYPLEVTRRAAVLRTERHWAVGPITHQGSAPHCVGHACSQFLRSAPRMAGNRKLPLPVEIYRRAQEIDEWPGTDYAGTSVRAGMKVLRELGLITEYRWARDSETVKNFVLSRGPVVVGTDWFVGMSEPYWGDNPKRKGKANDAFLVPEGGYEGGHAYLIVGYSRRRSAFRIVNSWGENWGERGRAWVEFENMNYLLSELNGEAVSAMEV